MFYLPRKRKSIDDKPAVDPLALAYYTHLEKLGQSKLSGKALKALIEKLKKSDKAVGGAQEVSEEMREKLNDDVIAARAVISERERYEGKNGFLSSDENCTKLSERMKIFALTHTRADSKREKMEKKKARRSSSITRTDSMDSAGPKPLMEELRKQKIEDIKTRTSIENIRLCQKMMGRYHPCQGAEGFAGDPADQLRLYATRLFVGKLPLGTNCASLFVDVEQAARKGLSAGYDRVKALFSEKYERKNASYDFNQAKKHLIELMMADPRMNVGIIALQPIEGSDPIQFRDMKAIRNQLFANTWEILKEHEQPFLAKASREELEGFLNIDLPGAIGDELGRYFKGPKETVEGSCRWQRRAAEQDLLKMQMALELRKELREHPETNQTKRQPDQFEWVDAGAVAEVKVRLSDPDRQQELAEKISKAQKAVKKKAAIRKEMMFRSIAGGILEIIQEKGIDNPTYFDVAQYTPHVIPPSWFTFDLGNKTVESNVRLIADMIQATLRAVRIDNKTEAFDLEASCREFLEVGRKKKKKKDRKSTVGANSLEERREALRSLLPKDGEVGDLTRLTEKVLSDYGVTDKESIDGFVDKSNLEMAAAAADTFAPAIKNLVQTWNNLPEALRTQQRWTGDLHSQLNMAENECLETLRGAEFAVDIGMDKRREFVRSIREKLASEFSDPTETLSPEKALLSCIELRSIVVEDNYAVMLDTVQVDRKILAEVQKMAAAKKREVFDPDLDNSDRPDDRRPSSEGLPAGYVQANNPHRLQGVSQTGHSPTYVQVDGADGPSYVTVEPVAIPNQADFSARMLVLDERNTKAPLESSTDTKTISQELGNTSETDLDPPDSKKDNGPLLLSAEGKGANAQTSKPIRPREPTPQPSPQNQKSGPRFGGRQSDD